MCHASVYSSKKKFYTTDGYRFPLCQTYFGLWMSDYIENTNNFYKKKRSNALLSAILPVLKCNVKKIEIL